MTDVERGRCFHAQLETLMQEPSHPDDEAHDEAVGLAIHLALAGHPQDATAYYNAWAQAAGYQPIQYLGTVQEAYIVDIGTTVIAMDLDGQVSLWKESRPCQQ